MFRDLITDIYNSFNDFISFDKKDEYYSIKDEEGNIKYRRRVIHFDYKKNNDVFKLFYTEKKVKKL